MKTLYQIMLAAWLALAGLHVHSAMGQVAKLHESYGVEGFSQPARLSKVAGRMAGILASKDFAEGAEVRAGDCLAKLDRTVQEHKLELAKLAMESQGELRSAQVEQVAQGMRLDAIRQLNSRGYATEVELRQAQADFDAARAAVLRVEERQMQLKADYERQLAEYEQYLIRAPFDGVIIDYTREVGEYVGPGEPHVCSVAQLSSLSVEFMLPRSLRSSVQIGQQVDVLFTAADTLVPGIVSYVSPFPADETGTYVTKVIVDNRERKLSAGERCQLSLGEPAMAGGSKHAEH